MIYDTELLGADETQPAAPFVRIVAPTDIQELSAVMSRIIKDYYPGLDWLNPSLWSKLGITTLSGPVVDFLQRLILLERTRHDSLSASTIASYQAQLKSKYNYNDADLLDYLQAFIDADKAGMVPASIKEPYNYTPTTAAEDIASVVREGVAPSLWSLAPLALGGLAIYAAITVLMPKLILRKA